MPELPEVETIRHGLQPFLEQKTIRDLQINRQDLRVPIPDNTRQMIQGQYVQFIKRHGKYLCVELANGQTIVWHMGMSGSVRVYHDDKEPYEPQKHDHIVMTTDAPATIVFNDPRRFGMFYTYPTEQILKTPPFSQMGCDALQSTVKTLYPQLQNKKSPIKTALLDQAIVAGLGNIYVCEALYKARISPFRLANALSFIEVEALSKHIDEILADAIQKGGSSLKDHRMTDGSMGYFQNFFGVYGKKGVACPHCTCDPEQTGGIKQAKQAGRSTFYCSEKQK